MIGGHPAGFLEGEKPGLAPWTKELAVEANRGRLRLHPLKGP